MTETGQLTHIDILNRNDQIATYLGWTPINISFSPLWIVGVHPYHQLTGLIRSPLDPAYDAAIELNFHRDYNWLMLAWEKLIQTKRVNEVPWRKGKTGQFLLDSASIGSCAVGINYVVQTTDGWRSPTINQYYDDPMFSTSDAQWFDKASRHAPLLALYVALSDYATDYNNTPKKRNVT